MSIEIKGNRKDDLLEDALTDSFFSNLDKDSKEEMTIGFSHLKKAPLREITGKTVLPKGKYIVDYPVKVPPGCELVLSGGVELYFAEGCGIENSGKLEIIGDKDLKVVLTALEDNWNGITAYHDGNLYIQHAILSNAKGKHGGALCNLCYGTTIRCSEFRNNHARRGGAIHVGHELNLEGSNIFENNSADEGGAISLHATLNLKGSNIFRNNNARTRGGAIYNKFQLSIEGHNLFELNTAESGGAIFTMEGTQYSPFHLYMIGRNVFRKNSATGDKSRGGAICSSRSNVKITGMNEFKENSAKFGMDIYACNGKLIVLGTNTFYNNSKLYAIYCYAVPNDRLDIHRMNVFEQGNGVYRC